MLKHKILERLKSAREEKSPEAEADLILFHVLRKHYPEIKTLSDLRLFSPKESDAPYREIEEEALKLADDRAKGKPLQHLLEQQYFLNHEYHVNASVLVPRPETEILISGAIDYLKKKYGPKPFRFAELGLGSGILSAELLAEFPRASGVASEISIQSIAVATQNLQKVVGPAWNNRIQILEPMNEFTGFEVFLEQAPFDLVISNPPYVSVNDEIESEVLSHEPHAALFPRVPAGEEENPNYFYENFLKHAFELLGEKGAAFFEVPHERAQSLLHMFQNRGFESVALLNDLTGRARVLAAFR